MDLFKISLKDLDEKTDLRINHDYECSHPGNWRYNSFICPECSRQVVWGRCKTPTNDYEQYGYGFLLHDKYYGHIRNKTVCADCLQRCGCSIPSLKSEQMECHLCHNKTCIQHDRYNEMLRVCGDCQSALILAKKITGLISSKPGWEERLNKLFDG